MNDREKAIDILKTLPEDISLKDILDTLYNILDLKDRLESLDENDVVSSEELKFGNQ